MGYVIPEIYIWEVGTDPETGDTKYSIVDGQQRIGAIVKYVNGEYPLTKAYLSDRDASYAGKRFNELSDVEKKSIWSYTLSFRKILGDVKKTDIVNLFLRLNYTDKSLNPQELRNAEYDGLFIKNAIEIANMDFWRKYSVFSPDALRRMGDVEFISSILIFLRKGIDSEITQKAINLSYDLYNEKYDEAKSDRETITNILNCIEILLERDKTSKFLSYIKKNTHLYTIMVALYKYVSDGKEMSEQQINNIINFYINYEDSAEKSAEEYRELLQGGTRSKMNRMRRVKILCEAIEGNK